MLTIPGGDCIHIVSLGIHSSDGEHVATVSPTRSRSLLQELVICAPIMELVHSSILPLTDGVGGEQPAERGRDRW